MKKLLTFVFGLLLATSWQSASADLRYYVDADGVGHYVEDPNYDRFAGLTEEEKEQSLDIASQIYKRDHERYELEQYTRSQGKSIEELIIEAHQALKH